MSSKGAKRQGGVALPGWLGSGGSKAVLVAVVVIGIVALGYLLLASTSGSSASSGTVAAGVDISGMSEEEAAKAVETAANPEVRKRVKVQALDETFLIRPARLGVTVDGAATVAPAFGRTWNPVDLVAGLFGGQELPVKLVVDRAAIATEVGAMADAVDVPPINAQVSVASGEIKVTPGEAGRTLEVETTTDAIIEALPLPRAPVRAAVTKEEPAIGEAQVEAARAFAQKAMSAPVTVQADMVTATIPAKAIGRALSFEATADGLVPSLDGAVLHESIASELAPIEVPGRDATFKIKNGKPRVVPSKLGRGVSDEELAAKVMGVIEQPTQPRDVVLTVGLREPALTTEQAAQLGVTEKLSSFTQQFPYAAYRVQNIGEAARRVNGTLLLPGETFSMNDTIKERTEENGYTVGFVVGTGGVFDEALGGGVSAATTTVWTGAFYAGLERVDTRAHSIYISRYKPGLEATVAWGLFDMKFRNDTPNAVFITTAMTNTSMSVSFWGTKEYDDIEAEYGERTNIRKFATIYDESKKCLGQGGVDGFTITVDRVFYKDGKEVRREPMTTTYKPAPEVICDAKPDKKKDGKGDGNAKGDSKADPSESASPSESAGPSESASPSESAGPSASGKPDKPKKPGKQGANASATGTRDQ